MGHEVVRELGALAVSALARVEVVAAIWRKQRLGELDVVDAHVLVAAFEADYHGTTTRSPRFVAVEISAEMLERAAELLAVHGLRAYDVVQLASALTVREADPGCRTFVAFDGQLRRAAALQRFTLLPA